MWGLHRKTKASNTLFLAHMTMVVTCRSSSSRSSRLLFPPTTKVDRVSFHRTSRQEIDEKQARPFGGLRAGELDLNAQSLVVFAMGLASTWGSVLLGGAPATCGRADHQSLRGSVPRLEGGKNTSIVVPGYDSCCNARNNNHHHQNSCVNSRRPTIYKARVRGKVVRGLHNTRKKLLYQLCCRY